jgi:Flp pilus assembly protein TadG
MKIANRIKRERVEEGQILVLFALFSFVLFGAMALALDAGYLMAERRQAQSAADAAALAGGIALMHGDSNTKVSSDAISYATLNGVKTTGAGAGTVQVSVTGDNHNGKVVVNVTAPVKRFFIGAIYSGNWNVGAHAVAEIVKYNDGDYALIALQPPGMYVNGNMTIKVIGGSAMSNGDVARSGGANAFKVDGKIDAVGSVNPNSNWVAPKGFRNNRSAITNPFAGAVPPNASALIKITSFPDCKTACTLSPGYYDGLGDQTIKGTATLLPGTYYFHGTSISLQNTNSRIVGVNVMLYFSGTPGSTYFDPKNGEVFLQSAPTSPYAGGPKQMAVWIDNCSVFDSQGNGEFYIGGIFLAPCSAVTIHGNPYGEAVKGQMVVGTLDVRGTSDIVVRYVDLGNVPRYELYLVE